MGDEALKPPADLELPAPPPHLAAGPTTRGCLFYGCVVVSGFVSLAVLAACVGLYVLYSRRDELISRFTAPQASPIPVVTLPADRQQDLDARMDRVEQARDPAQLFTLALSADELNALIARDPALRGKVALEIVGDELRADVSLPLESLGRFSGLLGDLKGRYLNGKALLEPAVEDNQITVKIRQLEVKGRKVPDDWLGTFSGGNHVRLDIEHSHRHDGEPPPGGPGVEHTIESIAVKDGKLVVRLRPHPLPPRGPRPPGPPPPDVPHGPEQPPEAP